MLVFPRHLDIGYRHLLANTLQDLLELLSIVIWLEAKWRGHENGSRLGLRCQILLNSLENSCDTRVQIQPRFSRAFFFGTSFVPSTKRIRENVALANPLLPLSVSFRLGPVV